MILLSMPHLVAEHDSDLIVVREHIKESRIHAHIVSVNGTVIGKTHAVKKCIFINKSF